jgi:hypothetical protein
MGIYPSNETYGIRFGVIYEENDIIKTNNLYELKYNELTNKIKNTIKEIYNDSLFTYKIVNINEYLAEDTIKNNLLLVETLNKCSCSYELDLKDYYEWFQITQYEFINKFIN